MLEAKDTVPGSFYRPTRDGAAGCYFMRPKVKLDAHIARLRKKGNQSCRDDWFVQLHKRNPNFIFLVCYPRGTDPMNGNRYESKNYILVAPDTRLREIARPPGYTG